jgi:CheY-like chemotaxis protein
MMLVLGGREMCQQMQANVYYQSIPFVVMSAASSTVNSEECHYAAVVTKPFDLSYVLMTIAKLIITSSPEQESGMN